MFSESEPKHPKSRTIRTTKSLHLRLLPADYALIYERAGGLPISEFISKIVRRRKAVMPGFDLWPVIRLGRRVVVALDALPTNVATTEEARQALVDVRRAIVETIQENRDPYDKALACGEGASAWRG